MRLNWFGHRLDYPMFVVTACAEGELSGCLVGFATQCSIHPIGLAAFISKKNHTYRVAVRSAALAVHVVPPDAMDLAELFGGETGDRVDKFQHWGWSEAPMGSPLLEGCPNWAEGPIVSSLDVGDHRCFVIEPHFGDTNGEVGFLPFRQAKRIEPGHEA